MKFTEILEELRKGKKVTREKWEKPGDSCAIDFIMHNQKKEKCEFYRAGECYDEFVWVYEDIIAEDWKIWVEKPKDIKIRNWQPKQSEIYYSILANGSIDYTTYDSNNRIDKQRLSSGNCFKTGEEAQCMLEKIKIINQLRKMSNISFEGNTETKKWFVVYDCDCQKIGYNYMYTNKIAPFNIYFASKEDCQKVIETIGEDNLKKYYFDVVD